MVELGKRSAAIGGSRIIRVLPREEEKQRCIMDNHFYYLDELLGEIEQAIGKFDEFEVLQKQATAILVKADGKAYKISIKPCRVSRLLTLAEMAKREAARR